MLQRLSCAIKFVMHVPKGNPIHQNLKTSYVNTAALLADLQVSSFTGYVDFTFPSASGLVFIIDGVIVNALDESGELVRKGGEAIDSLLVRASLPDGVISLYGHEPSVVEAIAGRIDGEPVYMNLDSAFTDLGKLVEKLLAQSDDNFYIEIEFSSEKSAVIYTVDKVVHAILPSDSDNNGQKDRSGYDQIVEMVDKTPATFHVFKCVPVNIEASANVIAFPEAKTSVEIHAQVEHQVDDIVPEPIVDDISVSPDSNASEKKSVENNVEKQDYSLSDEEVASTNSPDELDEEFLAKYEELVRLMGEVTQVVETTAMRVAKEGNFSVALRAGLLAVADHYPFFDPFADEFEYQNGKIRFSVTPPPDEFIRGLLLALNRAVREFERATSADVKKVLREALERLRSIKQEDLEEFGLINRILDIVED